MKKLLASLFLSLAAALTAHAQSVSLTPSATTYSSAGGTMTFTVNISYAGTVSALGLSIGSVPTGWTFASASGANVPEVRPAVGNGGNFSFSYSTIPATKTPTFTFTVNYASGLTGDQVFGSINLNLTPSGGSPASVSLTNITFTAAASGGGSGGNPATAPVITTQPVSITVNQNQSSAFGVVASGNPTPTYQWRKNGFDIFGATSAVYGYASTQISDGGTYAVAVSNTAGTVVSDTVTLTVNIPPSISAQPSSASVNQGQTAVFTVGATGTPPPTYQWRKNSANIAGATNSALQLTGVTASDIASYDVVVTNAAGAVTSSAVSLSVTLLPTVVTAPASSSVTAGASPSFSVTAGGTGPFTYQWRKNGSSLAGQNGSTLSLTSVTTADGGNYDVVISNSIGNVVSPYATLTVNSLPAITTPPFSVTTTAGQAAQFSVAVVSTSQPSFQWRKNGTPIVGANVAVLQFGGVTTAILTLPSVSSGDQATYDVVVTNTVGSVTSPASPPATLTLVTTPTITVQPASASATTGGFATFTVTATGTAPLTYQWRKNGVNISGGLNPTLTLINLTASDAANYDVVVTNPYGSATSAVAVLSAPNVLPSITTQPIAATGTAGGSATFTIVATGSPAPTYQWRKNGVVLNLNSSWTTATLSVTGLAASDVGNYDCVVTNSLGSIVSSLAPLSVNLPPTIVTQPGSYQAVTGGNGVFTVNVAGTGPFSYLWRKNGTSLAGANNVIVGNGTSSSTMTILGAQASDNANYDVVVTTPFGSVTSNGAATLFVVSSSSSSPSISTQPVSTTVNDSTAATFTVVAYNSPTGYQWYRNAAPITDGSNPSGTGIISGSTSSTLSLSAATAFDQQSYYVVVTNANGSTTSSAATLAVTKAPVFTTQPAGTTVAAGGSYTLTSVVSASGTIAYQWFKDGLVVSGATSASLSLASITLANAGNYTVMASNGVGSATSNAAAVIVTAAPTISLQPIDASVGQNQQFTLSVVAAGGPAPTYQWRLGGTPISGATNPTYTVFSAQPADAGNYDVVVTNATASVGSSTAVVTVSAIPQITTHPTGGNLNQGQSITFTVVATGGAPLSYQWYKDGTKLTGATASTLTLPSVASGNAGLYTATVSNGAGSATSGGALLQVSALPTITSEPASQSAFVGGNVTFTVTATGNPGPSYQWSKNGVNIDGAGFSSYTITNVQKTDAALYRVVVSNALGSVSSGPASLAVNDLPPAAPTITTQPVSYTGTIGTGTTLTVVATGQPAPTYQWRKDGTAISGATSSALSLTGTAAESGAYTVVVTNASGSVTSNTATVLIRPAVALPVIVVQPASRTLSTGASATLTVQATGQGPLTYQWRKDGTAISGATTAELALTSVTSANAGVYTVGVTNDGGTTTSANATVTVSSANAAPRIITQPLPQVALVGGSVTFTVVATGNPAPAYQWRKNGAAISGATTASLTLSNVQAADAAGYDVIALNSSGQAISALARLTVATAATAPVITRQPSDARVVAGRSVTLAVVASGTPAPTYQWRLNGSAISGATNASLLVSGVTSASAGAYSVVVTNTAGSVTSNNGNVTVLARSFAGAWFGTLGTGGSFALVVNDDNTGAFLGFLGSSKTSFVSRSVTINDDGTFRFAVSTTASTAASVNPDSAADTTAAGVDDLTFAGTIASDGSLTGASTTGVTLSLTAARANDSGATAALTGFYQAAASGSSAQTLVIVGPAGQAFVIEQSGATVDGGTGTISAAGALAVTTAGSQSVSGTVAADTGAVSATVTDSKSVSTSFSGYAAGSGALGTQRLLNISTRASAGVGEQAMIVGFVITGVESKTVLIRGVGPTLRTFGITNAAAAPRLDLARGSTVLATNVDWTKSSNTAEISAAAALSGAFPLGATSADSVILTTLPPGQYTASCSAADAKTGVALVEVYDLSGGTTAQKLVNISTRAVAGSGENVLTAGVVVSGNAPKRVLIRAVGPTLASFGLTTALARPQLTLFNSASASIATNAGWSTTADAGAIVEAAARAGAFAFPAGSLDAALLVNLAPGNYTAQVSGVGGTSGLALVEIYELP